MSTSQENKLSWLKEFYCNHIISKHGPESKIEETKEELRKKKKEGDFLWKHAGLKV